MHIWDLRTGECLKSWVHKKFDNWKLQWTDDEKVVAYNAASEIQFFEDSNFGKSTHSILRVLSTSGLYFLPSVLLSFLPLLCSIQMIEDKHTADF